MLFHYLSFVIDPINFWSSFRLFRYCHHFLRSPRVRSHWKAFYRVLPSFSIRWPFALVAHVAMFLFSSSSSSSSSSLLILMPIVFRLGLPSDGAFVAGASFRCGRLVFFSRKRKKSEECFALKVFPSFLLFSILLLTPSVASRLPSRLSRPLFCVFCWQHEKEEEEEAKEEEEKKWKERKTGRTDTHTHAHTSTKRWMNEKERERNPTSSSPFPAADEFYWVVFPRARLCAAFWLCFCSENVLFFLCSSYLFFFSKKTEFLVQSQPFSVESTSNEFLPSFSEALVVLPSFTGFYRVLLGFTGFY